MTKLSDEQAGDDEGGAMMAKYPPWLLRKGGSGFTKHGEKVFKLMRSEAVRAAFYLDCALRHPCPSNAASALDAVRDLAHALKAQAEGEDLGLG